MIARRPSPRLISSTIASCRSRCEGGEALPRADRSRHGILRQPGASRIRVYLALEDIDHSRTKTKSPQTNGIVERFHKTVLDEFYRIAFRKKIYGSIADLQVDLDRWVQSYNEERPPGKGMSSRQ